MEPENSPFPTPPPQPVAPAVSPVFPKKNNLVVILLSILLLITLLISGYLFLQVQNLAKQLAQIQVQPTPTPLSTEIPSPTPDLTANWKTYTASQILTKIGIDFSIKYPEEWFVNENNPSRGMSTPWVIMTENEVSDVLSRTSPCLSVSGGMWPDTVGMNGVIESQNSHQLILSPSGEKVPFIIPGASENFTIGNVIGIKRKVKRYNENIETMQVFIKGNANGPGETNYFIVESCPGTDENIFNQILSTFKFTD